MSLSSEASESTVKQNLWPSRHKWAAWLLGGITAVAIVGAAVMFRSKQQKQSWISDAEEVAIAYLQIPTNRPVADPRMPPELKVPYSDFRQLSGEGFAGAAWNIQGYEYLSADRLAHFENGDAEVQLLVTEGRITNPGSQNVEVLDIHWQQGAYTIPNGWRATITISHPELR